MQTSPGPKLISLTQWENTIIFPSPCIGLLRILSASCLLSYCSQFPNASVPTSKLNLSRNKWVFFLISLRMSSAATQNAGLCLHCFMLLQQWHSKTWWRPCVGCCAEKMTDCPSFLTLKTHSVQLQQETDPSQQQQCNWKFKSERQPKTLWTSGYGILGIRVIIIIRSIWNALAENSNERPRLRTSNILRSGIIFNPWPCFVCFYIVPLASPFLFQMLNSLNNTDRKQAQTQ